MNILYANRAAALLYRYVRTYPCTYILPANVCPVIPLTLCYAQVPFVFIDINDTTLCMDENKCMDLLPKETDIAVIFVRTYGCIYSADMFFKNLKSVNKNCRIIDDRCLCMPDLQFKSEYSDLILYSTGYSKPIDLNYGGIAILSSDIKLNKFDAHFMGYDIESYYKFAFAQNEKIEKVPEGWLDLTEFSHENMYVKRMQDIKRQVIEHKSRLNNIYDQELPSGLALPKDYQKWRYNIRVKDKNRILKELFSQNLFASSHYCPANRLFDNDRHINSEKLYNSVINLFNDNHYTEEMAYRTCQIIKKNL